MQGRHRPNLGLNTCKQGSYLSFSEENCVGDWARLTSRVLSPGSGSASLRVLGRRRVGTARAGGAVSRGVRSQRQRGHDESLAVCALARDRGGY